jgi:predicted PurR-regulated permease PerM
MDCSPPWQTPQSLSEFTKRVLVVLLLGSLAVALWRILDLVILLIGAVLIAVGLRSAARWLQRTTGLGTIPGLAVVVVLSITSFGLALWFFGNRCRCTDG